MCEVAAHAAASYVMFLYCSLLHFVLFLIFTDFTYFYVDLVSFPARSWQQKKKSSRLSCQQLAQKRVFSWFCAICWQEKVKIKCFCARRDVRNCDERAALSIATLPNSSQSSEINCSSNVLLMGGCMYLGPQTSDRSMWGCFGTLFVCAISRDVRNFWKRAAIACDSPPNTNVLPKQFLLEHAAHGRMQIYLATDVGLLHVMTFWKVLGMFYQAWCLKFWKKGRYCLRFASKYISNSKNNIFERKLSC